LLEKLDNTKELSDALISKALDSGASEH